MDKIRVDNLLWSCEPYKQYGEEFVERGITIYSLNNGYSFERLPTYEELKSFLATGDYGNDLCGSAGSIRVLNSAENRYDIFAVMDYLKSGLKFQVSWANIGKTFYISPLFPQYLNRKGLFTMPHNGVKVIPKLSELPFIYTKAVIAARNPIPSGSGYELDEGIMLMTANDNAPYVSFSNYSELQTLSPFTDPLDIIKVRQSALTSNSGAYGYKNRDIDFGSPFTVYGSAYTVEDAPNDLIVSFEDPISSGKGIITEITAVPQEYNGRVCYQTYVYWQTQYSMPRASWNTNTAATVSFIDQWGNSYGLEPRVDQGYLHAGYHYLTIYDDEIDGAEVISLAFSVTFPLSNPAVYNDPTFLNKFLTITIPRPPSDNNDINFIRVINSDTFEQIQEWAPANDASYSVIVPFEVENILLEAEKAHSKAKIEYEAGPHTLLVGNNNWNVVCTSQSGIVKSRLITITRLEENVEPPPPPEPEPEPDRSGEDELIYIINHPGHVLYPVITNYRYSIGLAYSEFFKKYIRGVQFSGRQSVCRKEQLLNLLNAYVEIIMDWTMPSFNDDTRKLTLDEIKRCEYNINKICGTNYTIFHNLNWVYNENY